MVQPRPRKPPYFDQDLPLIRTMRAAVERKELTPWQAADQLKDGAAGGNTQLESKQRRLYERYKEMYRKVRPSAHEFDWLGRTRRCPVGIQLRQHGHLVPIAALRLIAADG